MGNQMSGNFGVASTGVSGFMGKTAQDSLKKARLAGKFPGQKPQESEGDKKVRSQKSKE